jgi:rhodanese-related sulfurtransferase
MVQELSVEDLKARLDTGERPLVIDVREGWELDISHVPFARTQPTGCPLPRESRISVSQQFDRRNLGLGGTDRPLVASILSRTTSGQTRRRLL